VACLRLPPAHSPTEIVEIFAPSLLAGIDRLLAETILFEARLLRNPPLDAWRASETGHPFQIHETAKSRRLI
jgi:hypothetical protein